MYILIRVLINVHLLVNELCEYQNVRRNNKKNNTKFNQSSYVTFIKSNSNYTNTLLLLLNHFIFRLQFLKRSLIFNLSIFLINKAPFFSALRNYNQITGTNKQSYSILNYYVALNLRVHPLASLCFCYNIVYTSLLCTYTCSDSALTLLLALAPTLLFTQHLHQHCLCSFTITYASIDSALH